MTASSGSAAPGESELISRGYQGTVYVTAPGPERRIIKQAMGMPIVRRLRRAMIRREYAVYRRLAGIAGVPRCYGLQDGADLLLEYLDARPLRELGNELPDREAFFADLFELILSLHRAGVAHADLKHKGNILVGVDGRPYILDFGLAVLRKDSGGRWNRFLFEQACRIDLNAWIKLKYRNRYAAISAADRHIHRPTLIEAIARRLRPAWRRLTGRHRRKARRKRRKNR
jgi:predicted Ser/Thr protein kinase